MKSLTSVHRIVFLAIALLYGVPLSAQHETMTFGIKAGAQLTRSFSFDGGSITADAGAETNYIRPIIGLVFEKSLSPTISIQVDGLYNREKFRYQQQCVATPASGCTDPSIDWETHGHTLEFPFLLKKYWHSSNRDRYFANAGISFRSMTMSSWTNPSSASPCGSPPPYQGPFCEYVMQNTHGSFGFVIGGGADFQRGHFHFYPELRYTRWLGNEWTGNSSILQPNQNALNLLLGFTYGN